MNPAVSSSAIGFKLARLLRSVGVGGVGTAVDLLILVGLASGVGLGARVASPIALVAGLLVQFVGQKLFAFRDQRPQWGKQAVLFGLVEGVALVLNLWLFDLAVRLVPAPYPLLRVAVQFVVYVGLCLPLWSRIFSEREGVRA
jgi:putative flippase GtrA